MALIFLLGNHCHVYWCPPFHSGLPRGRPSAPLSSSILAVKRGGKKGKTVDLEMHEAYSRCCTEVMNGFLQQLDILILPTVAE